MFFNLRMVPENYFEKNDRDKNVIAVGYGYKIERIWEHDLEKEYKDTKKRLKDLLN